MRRLLLTLFMGIACSAGVAQPTLQQKLYYTCKVWGFVKYYHSEVSTCHVNWDSVLLRTLPLVRAATTNNQFNDALDTMLLAAGPMALSSTYFPDTLPTELKRNRDWAFMNAPIFRSDVKTILDTIKNNFRPHAGCWIGLNIPTASPSLSGYLTYGKDTMLLDVNTTVTYPDADHRQLLFFKFWNIVRYFNPYNYVLDSNIENSLSNYVMAFDTAMTAQGLNELCIRFATTLNDAHVRNGAGSTVYQHLPGFFQPSIRLRYINGDYVVRKSLIPGIYPGDVLISIDGITTAQWEDSLNEYNSAGNPSAFWRFMSINMLGRESVGVLETLVVKDSMNVNHTFAVSTVVPGTNMSFFDDIYFYKESLDTTKWTTLDCDIGYVNMGNLENSDVPAMYDELRAKNAIIFDLRYYPNGTAGYIANLMFAAKTNFAKFLKPDLIFPGTYYWELQHAGIDGNPNAYTGQVTILVNEVTISQAEYSAMILRAMPGAMVIGSQTMAADGDVSQLYIANDLHFAYSSVGVFYPNGDSTQRIGIVPDSVVYPTRDAIRHGRDLVLEKALKIAGCNLQTSNTVKGSAAIEVFPNPAHDKVYVAANNQRSDEVTITLTDVTGKMMMEHVVHSSNGQLQETIDIAGLAPGLYFVTVKSEGGMYMGKVVKE